MPTENDPSLSCTHDCSSCGEACASRAEPQSLQAAPHKNSHIKKVIAVMSGKGGVGKSLTASILAVNALRRGKKVAIIDADITGPSIPTIFGIKGYLTGDDTAIYPCETKNGIKAVSLNLMVDDPAEPVIWRGPVLAGLLKQFWTDVDYGEIDELYVDMPPGTGDVPLTVFQSLPVDAIVVVTTPQELVSLIVEKAVRMARMMDIPVISVVENMAYVSCPCCGEKVYPFGKVTGKVAEENGIAVYDSMPIDPKLGQLCDAGDIESYEGELLSATSEAIDVLR